MWGSRHSPFTGAKKTTGGWAFNKNIEARKKKQCNFKCYILKNANNFLWNKNFLSEMKAFTNEVICGNIKYKFNLFDR